MTVFSNLLVVGILLTIFILAYCRMKDKTLLEVAREIKNIFFGGGDDEQIV